MSRTAVANANLGRHVLVARPPDGRHVCSCGRSCADGVRYRRHVVLALSQLRSGRLAADYAAKHPCWTGGPR